MGTNRAGIPISADGWKRGEEIPWAIDSHGYCGARLVDHPLANGKEHRVRKSWYVLYEHYGRPQWIVNRLHEVTDKGAKAWHVHHGPQGKSVDTLDNLEFRRSNNHGNGVSLDEMEKYLRQERPQIFISLSDDV